MPWTNPRTWTTGEVVTAALLNTHVRDNLNAIGPIMRIYKTADESVSNSTTLQNDDHLFFSFGANEVWQFSGTLWVLEPASSDTNIRLTFAAPADASGVWGVSNLTAGSFDSANRLAFGGVATVALGSGANNILQITGLVAAGATAGTLQLQWAQGTAFAASTTMRQYSYLLAHRIA